MQNNTIEDYATEAASEAVAHHLGDIVFPVVNAPAALGSLVLAKLIIRSPVAARWSVLAHGQYGYELMARDGEFDLLTLREVQMAALRSNTSILASFVSALAPWHVWKVATPSADASGARLDGWARHLSQDDES